ncbi:hypothetical protein DE171_000775 [Clostridium beijerinckii]|nr:hypothetical protein [Clostridium beijerinckii]
MENIRRTNARQLTIIGIMSAFICTTAPFFNSYWHSTNYINKFSDLPYYIYNWKKGRNN